MSVNSPKYCFCRYSKPHLCHLCVINNIGHEPMPKSQPTKICRKCNADKPLYQYERNMKSADGRANLCKDCKIAEPNPRYIKINLKTKKSCNVALS